MKRHILNITLIILYLPGYIATGLAGGIDLAPRDMTRRPIVLAITLLYWLVILAGLALVIAAYLGK